MFAPLNIAVALVDLEVWVNSEPIDVPEDSSDRVLNNFIHYRHTTLLKRTPHDAAHLIS